MAEVRRAVEERLKHLPAYKPARPGRRETAAEFWARIEDVGLLVDALAVYDRLAAEREAWAHTRMETKEKFAARIEHEGRTAEMERVRAGLLQAGFPGREVQKELVAQFQPLSGDKTRAWETPDPWQGGRLFRSKATQDRLLQVRSASGQPGPQNGIEEDRKRLVRAEKRRDERLALAAARRRAEALEASPPNAKAPPEAAPRTVATDRCDVCSGRGGAHARHCRRYVQSLPSIPCEDCSGVVTPASVTYNWPRRHLCDRCYEKGRRLGWV
jgi:hypothetical protein